jgi:hypothetical protein
MTAKSVARVAIGTGLLLLIPLVAMLFTREVNWGPMDFVIAGALLLGTGCAYLFVASRTTNVKYRLAGGAALLLVLSTIWAHLAVGIF